MVFLLQGTWPQGLATASPTWNTYFSVPYGSICPRTHPDVFVLAGIQSEGGDTGLDAGLVYDNGGEFIDLGDGSGTIPTSMTVTSPEISTMSLGELNQPEMNIPGGLDTSGITSQVSFSWVQRVSPVLATTGHQRLPQMLKRV